MQRLPFPVWIFPIYIRSISDSANGLFVAMISEGHVYLLNPGETVSLECNFHADEYDLFEYPVLWRKTQQGEVTQVSVMGTIMEPFLVSGRFEVSFTSSASRYRLVLTISDVTHTDNGNYTCEVRAPEAVILGHVTHHVFVRAAVESVAILLEGNRSSNTPSGSSSTNPSGHGQGSGPPAGSGVGFPGHGAALPVLRSMHLMEGRPSTIGCLCLGGYPPPSLAIRVGRRDLSADCSFRNSASLSGERGLRTMDYRTERWTTRFVARAEDDEALVRCVAQVPGLEAHVESVKIYVQYSPKIICYSAGAQVGDKNVNLQCDIVSRPRFSSLAWLIDSNGTTVSEEHSVHDHWTIVTDRHDGVVVAKLFIRKIKPDNFRKYTLVVENSIASATKVVELQQRYRSTSERPQSDATAAGSFDDKNSRVGAHVQPFENDKSPSNDAKSLHCHGRLTTTIIATKFATFTTFRDLLLLRRYDAIFLFALRVLLCCR